ncbi:MAG: HAMP domain-containing histidine kinase [Candidatus Marinimicrobia bacterium]|nr:HAMP domain-containing histidine kinase [Candidatus Neomarinimicrobiota bacterium]
MLFGGLGVHAASGCFCVFQILFAADGSRIGFRGIDRDITQQVEAEEQLQASEEKYKLISEQLTHSNNLKALLLDVITHDLKNPAGVIKSCAALHDNEFEDNEYLQLIKSSSEKLFSVIDNAVTLSQLSLGESIELSPMDLVPLVNDVTQLDQALAREKGLELILDLPESLQVNTNPIIREVFENYLSNACKYAQAGKRILVRIKQFETEVVCEVLDWGTAIPSEEQESIFDRKTQLDPTTARRPPDF